MGMSFGSRVSELRMMTPADLGFSDDSQVAEV